MQKGKFSAAASALSPRRLKSEDLPTLRVRARGGGGVRVNGAQCAVRVERVWARRKDGGSEKERVRGRAKARGSE